MVQTCHNDVMKQQQSFDQLAEKAQILMQSSTDGRVSTQLTQLSSRYAALITLSKVSLQNSYDFYIIIKRGQITYWVACSPTELMSRVQMQGSNNLYLKAKCFGFHSVPHIKLIG